MVKVRMPTRNNQPKKKAKGKNPAPRRAPTKGPTPFADAGGVLGGLAGSFLGHPKAGSAVGRYLGSGVGKIFGMGAYSMKQNSIFDSTTQDQVPFMHSTDGSIRIRHREFLTDIQSSTGFAAVAYQVNPGLRSSFPYLSAIAQQFEEYEFKGLVYEFKSTSADALNSTNTALGTVAMAAQYRADAPNFISKSDVLNHFWSTDTKPSNSALLPIECDPRENPGKVLYIRANALTGAQDKKWYDLCQVCVATYGMQAVATIGELWVSYDIVLRKPNPSLSQGLGIPLLSGYTNPPTSTGAQPFGSSRVVYYDNFGATYTPTAITIPPLYEGNYLFTYQLGAVGTLTGTPVVTLTNATQAGTLWYTSNATNLTLWVTLSIISVSYPTTIALSGLTTATGGYSHWQLTQANPAITGA